MRNIRLRGIGVALCLLLSFGPRIHAESNSWFNDEWSLDFTRSDWMGQMPDTVLISQLAIPGTHETMARGDWDQPAAVQCQSVPLSGLLQAGIRALDIRCRHINNTFAIHHGPFYQNANFTDVMDACTDFLDDHPAEVILMRVQDEYDDEGNTRTFMQTLKAYLANYPGRVWTTQDYTIMPPLGDVRGLIMLMDNWERDSVIDGDEQLGIPWGWVENQDKYSIRHSRAAFDRKWGYIKDTLIAARDGLPDHLYSNFTSGNIPDDWDPDDLLITPKKVAYGMYIVEWPPWESGWEDGMNERIYRYLRARLMDHELWRTGMIMMDFPGRGLIDVIIAHNGLGMDLQDDPPVAEAGGPYFVDECSSVQVDGSGSTDFEGDTLHFRWDLNGDGEWDTDWSLDPTAWFVAGDNMDTLVNLLVWDGATILLGPAPTGMDQDAAAMIVQNVAPIVSMDSVISMIPGCIMPGHEVHFYGRFTDPGYMDTHVAVWDFADGTVIPGTLTEENEPPDATGQSDAAHTFDSAALFAVTLTVTDDDSGAGQVEFPALVRTPAQVCQFMDSVVQSLPNSAFTPPARQHQNALSNKIQATENAVQVGHQVGPQQKLINDLRRKWDGTVDGDGTDDWLIDPDAQALLCLTVDELVAYLEAEDAHGDGASNGGFIVGSELPAGIVLPTAFVLEQNYPNPFNPQTRIGFVLAADAYVELAVYNTAGQRVRTLVEGWLGAGPHSVVWDGRGTAGAPVASGLYVYRLSAAGETSSRKMLLLR